MSVAARPIPPTKTPIPRLQSRPSSSALQPKPRPALPPSETISNATPSSSKPLATKPPAKTSPPARAPPLPSSSSSSSTPAMTAATALGSVPGKDTSSSAGKVFAKPSKEWVLPERAKPGRKVSADEPDNKRQSQNRLSQRAHRARRTDYITTLEERIRQYEADEIHSNVRLQEVARALKADNERLKKEVVTLKLQLADRSAEQSIEDDRHAFEEEMSRLREEVQLLRKQVGHHAPSNHSGSHSHGRDRHWQPQPRPEPQLSTHQHSGTPTTVNPRILTPEPSLPRENRTLVACPICPDPDPDCPCQQAQSGAPPSPGSTVQLPPIRAAAQTTMVSPPSTCGLCQSTEECLCRAVDEAEAAAGALGEVEGIDTKPILPPSHLDDRSPVDDSCGLCTGGEFCACKAVASNDPSSPTVAAVASATAVAVAQGPSSSSSSAALPLRLRVRGTLKTSIWALDNPTATPPPAPTPNASASVPVNSRPTLVRNASASRSEAVCSGDPSNCDACRNDSFGQEFCSHLFGNPLQPCETCTGNCMSIPSLLNSSNPSISSSGASVPLRRPIPVRPIPVRQSSHTAPGPLRQASSSSSAYSDEDPRAPLVMACCGEPGLCGTHAAGCAGEIIGLGPNTATDSTSTSTSSKRHRSSITSSSTHRREVGHDHDHDHDTMRPEQAWRALKAHPNSKFASLALLADVVARRTKCAGADDPGYPTLNVPTTGSAGALGPAGPERPASPATVAIHAALSEGSARGKRKVEVDSSAVREALRMLDSTPAPGDAEEGEREAKRAKRD
ncbi:hypothetical protein JCM24511_02827 [Saitozyma sp. JCM 24511]|nr:hypothetical protein JCM24511_02827 [Saitozyma sp. JCM 24511]